MRNRSQVFTKLDEEPIREKIILREAKMLAHLNPFANAVSGIFGAARAQIAKHPLEASLVAGAVLGHCSFEMVSSVLPYTGFAPDLPFAHLNRFLGNSIAGIGALGATFSLVANKASRPSLSGDSFRDSRVLESIRARNIIDLASWCLYAPVLGSLFAMNLITYADSVGLQVPEALQSLVASPANGHQSHARRAF